MSISRMYCPKCRDFTYRTYTKRVSCNQCRAKGHPLVVYGIIGLCVFVFLVACIRLAYGGGW